MSIRVEVPGTGIVEFPDGTPPAEMERALATVPSGAQPDVTGGILPGMRPTPGSGTRWQQPNYGQRAVNAIPGAASLAGMIGGGALGGLAGGAGAPAGAMLGAGLGDVAGQWMRYGLGPSVGMDVPMPGVRQSGLETAADLGLAATGVASKATAAALAPRAMRTGLRMPPTWREQWMAKVAGETPEQAAIRMGVTSESGASAVLGRATAATARRIIAAERKGSIFTAEDLAKGALRQAEKKAGRPLTKPERRRIIRGTARTADELLNESAMGVKVRNVPKGTKPETVPFTPTQVYSLKQTAQTMSRGRFGQEAQGVNLKATPNEIHILSKSARGVLAGLPGVAKSTGEAHKAVQLRKTLSRGEAVQRTSLPQLGAGALGASAAGALGMTHGGGGAAIAAPMGAFLGHSLASPEAQRHLALLLANPMLQRALLYGPMAGSIPARMAMTTPFAVPDTLPPNPSWGMDDPNNP